MIEIKATATYTRVYFNVYRNDGQELTAEQALDIVRKRTEVHDDDVAAVRLINHNERLVIIEKQSDV